MEAARGDQLEEMKGDILQSIKQQLDKQSKDMREALLLLEAIMILMEKAAIFPTDVETSKDFALILYAAKQTMLSAERIRTPTATRLIMNPS